MTIRTWLLWGLLLGLTYPISASESNHEKKITKGLKTIGKMIKKKDYENAMFIIDGLLKENQTHSGVLYEKAHVLELQKEMPDAIKAYEKCLEILLEADTSTENKKRIDKIKKALLRIDKSRRIVMKHATELEREAKKLKSKDEYAYEKIMDIVSYMRGAWNEDKEDDGNGSNKSKKRKLAKRHKVFITALINNNVEEALSFIDPLTIRYVGKRKVEGYLLEMIGATRKVEVKKGNIGKTKVTIGKGGKNAKVEGSFRKNGKTYPADPEYWIFKNKKWYIGDEEKLKDFHADEDK